MRSSVSAQAIRGSYIDEATKRALLGPGSSFGLPMSTLTTFKASALEEGPVVLVPAMAGMMIVPLHVLAGASEELPADISAQLGWPNPDPENPTEHDEPWLGAATTLWYGGAEQGSLVLLPNSGAMPIPHIWPECLMSRPFVVTTEAAAARKTKKTRTHAPEQEEKDEAEAESRYQAGKAGKAGKAGEEEPPDPELSVVVFYTVF